MKNLLYAAVLGAALAGCHPAGTGAGEAAATPGEQVKILTDSLMQRHERVMSQADQVVALAAQLQARPVPPRPVLARLKTADEAMMTWMHQYAPPDSAAPAPQQLEYLQGQQRKLATVQQGLAVALDSARAALRRPAAPAPAAPAAAPARPRRR